MTIAPEGRKLLRIEARNAAVPIEKKPAITMPSTTVSRNMVSGMNGSGARTSRQANAAHNAADAPMRPRIVGEIQGCRLPPQASASSGKNTKGWAQASLSIVGTATSPASDRPRKRHAASSQRTTRVDCICSSRLLPPVKAEPVPEQSCGPGHHCHSTPE